MALADDKKYNGDKNSTVDLDLPKTIRKQTLFISNLAVINNKVVSFP